MNHKKVAQDILSAIGEDNLIAAAHCATRLRLVIKRFQSRRSKGFRRTRRY